MREVVREDLVRCLRAVGLALGDGVLVHAAIQYLGRPARGIGVYLDAFREVLGAEGTLVVPVFNFGFCRGEPFDRQATPSEGMGVFSEHVRSQPEAHRTTHPMQSVAAIGRYAVDLAGRDTRSAFDEDSAFARMLELDFKLLLLGAPVQAASIVHWSEQRAAVPYRYWKEFRGTVIDRGARREAAYAMFVRDLDVDPQLDLRPIQDLLQQSGLWTETRLNYGTIAACRLRDFVDAEDRLLREDPWALVGNAAQVRRRATEPKRASP